jgi:hypothetical protein
MAWVPRSAWLTKLEVNSSAADLQYDLAVDTSGRNSPSPVDAGLRLPDVGGGSDIPWPFIWLAGGLALIALMRLALDRRRPAEA